MRVWLYHQRAGRTPLFSWALLACDAGDFEQGLQSVPDLLLSGWNVTMDRQGHMWALRRKVHHA